MGLWIAVMLLWGYAVGCLHGSVVAQKISGVNLKETGVKNAGASNATIVLGKKFGALVAAIDIGKGAGAVLLVHYFTKNAGLPEDSVALLLFLTAAAAVIGHNFPFYMNFNGGKGTATIIGVLLAIDWRVGLIGFVLFVVVALVTDFLVFGVLMLYVTLIAMAVRADGYWPIVIAALLFAIAIWKHLENFQRMKERSEKRVSMVFKKNIL
ncbi:glycerol-3-phosphate acyltransferase [Sporosarcina sp. ANT_H38]|uniref:glycerol-3-phosphate acyltransferase n=1 Tax=Sporosarcina sp. ANT_H38 TaxID=2597358 RepID=UPI0011F3EF48|nr:glycerol-3-phosphate acyltransferase [Sporosarcina sp. ANT_H38]KAA0955837.1 glycerol-3-phosphate acyltransferase [Sporosarcina sp. ANT_H38]